mmetsp:Transcript_13146/g.50300  ORF Transcript_13146/g.50300 Transcript_13146/m.50300 type:complete len:383 (-) Transcript_13146:358-1506(-)
MRRRDGGCISDLATSRRDGRREPGEAGAAGSGKAGDVGGTVGSSGVLTPHRRRRCGNSMSRSLRPERAAARLRRRTVEVGRSLSTSSDMVVRMLPCVAGVLPNRREWALGVALPMPGVAAAVAGGACSSSVPADALPPAATDAAAAGGVATALRWAGGAVLGVPAPARPTPAGSRRRLAAASTGVTGRRAPMDAPGTGSSASSMLTERAFSASPGACRNANVPALTARSEPPSGASVSVARRRCAFIASARGRLPASSSLEGSSLSPSLHSSDSPSSSSAALLPAAHPDVAARRKQARTDQNAMGERADPPKMKRRTNATAVGAATAAARVMGSTRCANDEKTRMPRKSIVASPCATGHQMRAYPAIPASPGSSLRSSRALR